jgi:MATE family multidrug resistance protein
MQENLLQDKNNFNQSIPISQKQFVNKRMEEWIELLMVILYNAIPSTCGLLFIFLTETISIIFIGNLNDADLISGIGIGTLYINATGYILGIGLIGGLDTLCSQAYGAKEYKLMGIYTNICRLITIGFFIGICLPCIIWCESLLLMIGQSSVVAEIASRFCKSMIPSVFFALQYNNSVRYLQAMNIYIPGMLVAMITSLLHIVWCFLLITFLDLGVRGAGLSMGITQLLNFVLISTYIYNRNPCPESYFSFTVDTVDIGKIWNFLKFAVPAAILFSADWLGFEVLVLMSSYLGSENLAANICIFNFVSFMFNIPMGLSFATTTLVGNSIGRRDVKLAKKISIISLCTGMFIVGLFTIIIYTFRNFIPYIYTHKEEVSVIFSKTMSIFMLFIVIDAVQIILHGIIKGLGKQRIASVIALLILYPVNIPLAYTLTFTVNYGLSGLWYSQLISVILLSIGYIIIILCLDWKHVAKRALESLEETKFEIYKYDKIHNS